MASYDSLGEQEQAIVREELAERMAALHGELTTQRVLERVRRGGPAVPEQKIRDRYARR